MFKIYILLTFAVLFWSGNFVFARFINGEIHPMLLSYLRWVGVLALLSFYILKRRKILLEVFRSSSFIITLLGGLGVAGFNTFLYYGLQDTTATNALLINSSIPIIIVALSGIILKERIDLFQTLGIILSTFGVIFLVIKGDFENLLQLEFNQGDMFILLSSLDWALYSVLLKYRPKNIESLDFISLTVIVGVIVLTLLLPVLDVDVLINYSELPMNVYIALSYMVIFPSLLSYFFWNRGVEVIGANKTGQFTHLMPVFGSILAYFVLGEMIENYHIFGIVFIAIGIYFALFFKRS